MTLQWMKVQKKRKIQENTASSKALSSLGSGTFHAAFPLPWKPKLQKKVILRRERRKYILKDEFMHSQRGCFWCVKSGTVFSEWQGHSVAKPCTENKNSVTKPKRYVRKWTSRRQPRIDFAEKKVERKRGCLTLFCRNILLTGVKIHFQSCTTSFLTNSWKWH